MGDEAKNVDRPAVLEGPLAAIAETHRVVAEAKRVGATGTMHEHLAAERARTEARGGTWAACGHGDVGAALVLEKLGIELCAGCFFKLAQDTINAVGAAAASAAGKLPSGVIKLSDGTYMRNAADTRAATKKETLRILRPLEEGRGRGTRGVDRPAERRRG